MAADRSELGRRQFVAAVGVAAGVAATAGAGAAASGALGAPEPARTVPLDPDVRALFGDVAPGARLDRWVIEAVHPLRMGAIPVVMRTADGVRFQVDVLRRDRATGARLGVGNTEQLSIFLSNRGDGARATDEEQGLGAMVLADALRAREASGAAAPDALTTHAQRRARHPLGSYSVLT